MSDTLRCWLALWQVVLGLLSPLDAIPSLMLYILEAVALFASSCSLRTFAACLHVPRIFIACLRCFDAVVLCCCTSAGFL